ncbi:hypothetical protein L1987_04027 [Smallanthus sonchifolius]|uniref:Uncharacterized protein n=1 Tax=Smallanthus sonchifolius TaxID=185202 RepID=A0ACB9KC80_9ASTR|nr:hypothetical protein L1987_04027 [Smallanthus sonchifolius]
MAPDILRVQSPDCFTPRVVSIGPLHRASENLKAFEGQKASYVMNLITRIDSPKEEILKSCMQEAHASMEQIKACYVWTIPCPDVDIAEMMVIDACFILEFIHQISGFNVSFLGNMLQAQIVTCDLVLLENQIPFFFLNKIFHCTILKNHPHLSLIEFIYPLLDCLNLFKANIKPDNISIDTTHDHILSLLHQCYKPPHYIKPVSSRTTISSAEVLDIAGVNFKPNKDPTWVMGMEVKLNRFPCLFGSWRRPTLKMPVLHVKDFSELVLRNLIAYEQESNQTRKYIASYVVAIDMLLYDKQDVTKLVHSRVLVNNMGSPEEFINMINNIRLHVASKDFFYGEQWEMLSNYLDNNMAWRRRWCSSLASEDRRSVAIGDDSGARNSTGFWWKESGLFAMREEFVLMENLIHVGSQTNSTKRRRSERISQKCFSRFTNSFESPLVICSEEEDNIILDATFVEGMDNQLRTRKKKVMKQNSNKDEGAVGDQQKKKKKQSLEEIGHFEPIANEFYAIKNRCSPSQLYRAIKKMSEKQKQGVKLMGFGNILKMKIDGIPQKLGHFVIDSFDESIMGIRLPGKIIKFNEKTIYNLTGIPNSGIDLGSIVPTKDLDTRLLEWKEMYSTDYISPCEIVTRLLKDSGNDSFFFQVDFLVLFLATMVECYSHGKCKLNVLHYFHGETDISKFNWCGYVLSCIRNCKNRWIRNTKSPFLGPLTILTLIYVDFVQCKGMIVDRSVSALEFWDVDLL